MSILFNIPWEITRSILTEWSFSLKGIGRIEIALGKSTHSEYFRDHLKTLEFRPDYKDCSLSLYKWIHSRHVRFLYFNIGDCFLKYFEEYSFSDFPLDSVLEVMAMNSTEMTPVVATVLSKCHSLKTYAANGFNVLALIDSALLSSFKFIHLGNVDNQFESDIIAVSKYCSSLQTYRVKEQLNDDFIFQDLHEIVVRKNPLLEGIEIEARTTILKLIAEHCPLTKTIYLEGVDDDCDLELVALAVSKLPHLTYLHFGGRGEYGRAEGCKAFRLYCDCVEYMLSTVFSKIPELTELHLPQQQISDELVRTFLAHSGHTVQDITLQEMNDLTETSIQDMLQCPQLFRVIFGGWHWQIDMGNVFSVPNKVKHLDLSASVIDLPSVIRILSKCEYLMSIEILARDLTQLEDMKTVLIKIYKEGRNIFFRACFIGAPWLVFKNGEFGGL